MPPPRQATLRDIARTAKLSLAAVSMALNRHPNIPPKTRRAIEAVAKRLGYVPDTRLSELMAYLRNIKAGRYHETLAYVSSHPKTQLPHWQQPYFHGASTQAEQLGYKLAFFWAEEPGLTNRRLSDILYRRGIRGLLIAPLLVEKSEVQLNWNIFSSVALGYTLIRPRINRVLNHHFNTVMLAMSKLVERGYRRIALAIEPINNQSVNYLWKAGYLTAHEILRLRTAPLFCIAPFDPDGFYRWFKRTKPDAVIANGVGYFLALHERGLMAPDDFGFVSLTVEEKAPKVLARVDQNHEQQGAAAVRLLAAQLLHNEIGIPVVPQLVMLESTWVEGETIAAENSGRKNEPNALSNLSLI
jgi:LacI family transcriptional regulator